MIVVEAAALTDALVVDGGRGDWARSQLAQDPRWCAPDYMLAEVYSAVRGLRLGHVVTRQRARDALAVLKQIAIELVPTRDLLEFMDELGDAVGAYDAGYVAVAARRDVALVTTDGRLARGAAGRCRIIAPEGRRTGA